MEEEFEIETEKEHWGDMRETHKGLASQKSKKVTSKKKVTCDLREKSFSSVNPS